MPEVQHSGIRPEGGTGESEAIEDYAKTIYALQRRGAGNGDAAVGTSALAERLGVSPASATAMIKRMTALGLTEHELYRGVRLTESGERVALEVIRHHRLIESYLAEALGMPWDQVHAEAEVLEHHISEELEERMAAALGNPTHDPHGDPIPDRQLSVATGAPAVPLASLLPGDQGRLSRVSDSDPDMLRYLAEQGITVGSILAVTSNDPFGGGVLVELDGVAHPIGTELARRMLVER